MGIPVSELPGRISANEIAFYAASYQLYPGVGELIDMLTAVLCAVNSRDKSIEDFMPDRFRVDDPDPLGEWGEFIRRMDSAAEA